MASILASSVFSWPFRSPGLMSKRMFSRLTLPRWRMGLWRPSSAMVSFTTSSSPVYTAVAVRHSTGNRRPSRLAERRKSPKNQ